jgi:tRNA1(Val) A37 N6-methylase TrmN6
MHYQNEGLDVNGGMNRENHMFHNNNPEYWSILVKDTEDPSFKNKIGLDFGCGCGRNILNLHDRFLKFDGVDIDLNIYLYLNIYLNINIYLKYIF